jgi:hypothetical protein
LDHLKPSLILAVKLTHYLFAQVLFAADYLEGGWCNNDKPNGHANVLMLGDGQGSFTHGLSLPAYIGRTRHIIAADWNEDGWLDTYWCTWADFLCGQSDLLILSDGIGGYTAPCWAPSAFNQVVMCTEKTPAPDGYSTGGVSADWNMDGHADLLVTSSATPNRLYWGDGKGQLALESTSLTFRDALSSYDAITADVDGDGFEDILIANSGGYNNQLLLNRFGNGTFTEVFVGAFVTDGGDSRDLIAADWCVGSGLLYTIDSITLEPI